MARKIYLAMPSMTGKPDVESFHCLVESVRELERAGHEVYMKFVIRDGMLPRMRNQYLMHFIQSGADDLVFIDDDMAWEVGALERLLSHPVDLVGGVYPKRQDKLTYPCKRLPGAELDRATGLLEMRYLPTGFLRITRACALRMVEAFKDRVYHEPDAPGGKAYAVFWFDLMPGEDGGGMNEIWGEDFSFCRRWREIGGQVWCDTYLTFKHIGRKAWQGCYADDAGLVKLEAAQ